MRRRLLLFRHAEGFRCFSFVLPVSKVNERLWNALTKILKSKEKDTLSNW
jgi:hypothetical protein